MSLLVSTALPNAPAGVPAAPWVPDRGDGTYQNPVLFADYSDPDVVRVGDDYWLVSSSFSHVPGLPVLHSKDLVNWELVNHALPTLSYDDGTGKSLGEHFNVPRPGAGVWAPSIRFHAGKFWVFFPDPDFGLYVVTATDPRGAWSAPICVKAGKGLIDPCPLWDDDGKVYLVHGWAKSRAGKNNLITLNELSPDATRVLDGEGTVIIDENTAGRGLTTLEGPKFYRHAGEYWIFAPVNGVQTGTQAVYRSRNLRGPYEVRIVLAQGSTAINGPHQGGWVDTPSGENWFMHFQDRGPFGRVVHLEPMSWGRDGWPMMGTSAVPEAAGTNPRRNEPVLTYRKPAAASVALTAPATSDEFNSPTLGLQWQWQANPQPEFFSLTAKRGALRLNCVAAATATSLYHAPNLLLQKFPAPAFTASTVLDFSPKSERDTAGLIVVGYDCAGIRARACPGGYCLEQFTQKDQGKSDSEIGDSKVRTGPIYLRVVCGPDAKCRFAVSADGITFAPFGDEFQATVGRWVGAKVGLFASTAPGAVSAGHADFDWFHVTP